MIIQSILVCTANLGASGVYVYMQFFPAPEWVIFMGHLCWQMANGTLFVLLEMVRFRYSRICLPYLEQDGPGNSSRDYGTT